MLKISISGVDGIMAVLGQTAGAVNATEILDEAEAILLNRIRARFLSEQGPDSPWPVSRAAMIRKSGGYTTRGGKRYTGTGTLFESGNLFHSIQAHAVDSTTRAIGTDVPYGPSHQFGTDGLPVREFLGFNEEDSAVIEKMLVHRMEGVS